MRNVHTDQIICISDENELINEDEKVQEYTKRLSGGIISPRSYTNIQTTTQINFDKSKNNKQKKYKLSKKKKSKLNTSAKKQRSIQKLHYGSHKLNIIAMVNLISKLNIEEFISEKT